MLDFLWGCLCHSGKVGEIDGCFFQRGKVVCWERVASHLALLGHVSQPSVHMPPPMARGSLSGNAWLMDGAAEEPERPRTPPHRTPNHLKTKLRPASGTWKTACSREYGPFLVALPVWTRPGPSAPPTEISGVGVAH